MKRNFENYRTRHEAYLAFKALPVPYWFEDDGINAYMCIEFDEWLWLPEQKERAYPKSWRKEYLGID